MKVVLFLLAVPFVLAGALWVLGWFTSPTHSAACSVWIPADPDRVYCTIRNVTGYPAWRRDVERVELLDDGRQPLRWREHARREVLTLELVAETPSVRIETRIADPTLPFGGSWTYSFQRSGGGTEVTVRENGVVRPPLYRAMARLFFGHTRTMKTVLKSLSRHFGGTAKPRILRAS